MFTKMVSPPGKTYFASDFHLGTPTPEASRAREHKILRWLDAIESDAQALYLVGDVFDFWFEYQTVVPKGAVRLLGKLAEWSDRGVDIHLFAGNHDLWMRDYLPNEIGITVHHQPLQIELDGKQFFIGHGDGLGPNDYGYKRLKKIFTNPFCQWLFRWLHPDLGMRLAQRSSHASRDAQTAPESFLGLKREWLLQYANRKLEQLPNTDYFIFGHRHLPLDIVLHNQHSRYINLGEWLDACTYVEFDGHTLTLRAFENPDFEPICLNVAELPA